MKKKEYEPGVWIVFKESGMTMGQLTALFKQELNIPDAIPVTFAGRLDPLVIGLVVLLVGERVHEKNQWTRMDKEYEAGILIGISTDTYDIFGIPTETKICSEDDLLKAEHALKELADTSFSYPYPPFSSKTVGGKPLWLISRDEGVSPDRPESVFRVKGVVTCDKQTITFSEVFNKVSFLVKTVPGDFRQQAIHEAWSEMRGYSYHLLRACVSVGSGTYVRSLAHLIHEKTGIPACIFSLERTKIGLIHKTFLEH